jgi:hypothetical protein
MANPVIGQIAPVVKEMESEIFYWNGTHGRLK